jgi:Spy/CpxP family protein refolding chaperone
MKKYFAGLMILGMLGGAAFLGAQEKPAPAQAPKAKPAPTAPAQRGQMPLERLKNALGLTDDQAAKLQESRKAQQEAQKGFREQMQKLRGELAPLLKDPKADAAKVNGLIDQMSKLGADQAKKGFQERGALAKILTPDQLVKFQSFRGGMAMGMGMRGGMGMGRGIAPMGRGQMMGPRGGAMMGPGMGMRMGMRPGMGMRGRFGMGFGAARGVRPQRGFRGWRWIR